MIVRAIRRWQSFWFGLDSRSHFRVFRAVFGFVLFVTYLDRGRDLDLLFGPSGLASHAVIDEIFSDGFPLRLHWIFTSPERIHAAHGLFLGALLWMAISRRGARISAWIALSLHLIFFHRNPTVAYGVDFVASFYLLFIGLGDHRKPQADSGNAPVPQDFRAWLGSAAMRLAQIQLCIIYGYAGIKKLKGLQWWNGQALWDAVANPLMARVDFSALASHPLLILAVTYFVLAWEIYFPVLIWNRRLRMPILFFGILLHGLIAFSLNIPYFAAAMVATYVFFLEKNSVNRILRAWE